MHQVLARLQRTETEQILAGRNPVACLYFLDPLGRLFLVEHLLRGGQGRDEDPVRRDSQHRGDVFGCRARNGNHEILRQDAVGDRAHLGLRGRIHPLRMQQRNEVVNRDGAGPGGNPPPGRERRAERVDHVERSGQAGPARGGVEQRQARAVAPRIAARGFFRDDEGDECGRLRVGHPGLLPRPQDLPSQPAVILAIVGEQQQLAGPIGLGGNVEGDVGSTQHCPQQLFGGPEDSRTGQLDIVSPAQDVGVQEDPDHSLPQKSRARLRPMSTAE